MPKTRQPDLTEAQRWRLARALETVRDYEDAAAIARVRFASLSLEFGIATVARQLGISHEAVRQRVGAVRELAEKDLARRTNQAEIMRRKRPISDDEKQAMLVAQGFRCALCGVSLTRANQHLDHDHESGEPRAYLCASCNKRVGMLEANLDYVPSRSSFVAGESIQPSLWRELALAYLSQHPSVLTRQAKQAT